MTLEQQTDKAKWVYDYYSEAKASIKDEELWPFCIPSYKRGTSAKTIDRACESGRVKVYLFIYEFDIPNYQHYLDKYENLELVVCSGFKGIVPKRNFINKTMYEKGFDNIFVSDDDMNAFYFGVPGTTKDGERYTTKREPVDLADYLKVWQYTVTKQYNNKFNDGTPKTIGMSGTLFTNSAAFVPLFKGKDAILNKSVASVIQIVHLNVKDIVRRGISYRGGCYDDFDMIAQLLDSGLDVVQNSMLSYSCDIMDPSTSVCRNSTADDNQELKLSVGLQENWGSYYSKIIFRKGVYNVRFNWIRLRKDFNEFKCLPNKDKSEYKNELEALNERIRNGEN